MSSSPLFAAIITATSTNTEPVVLCNEKHQSVESFDDDGSSDSDGVWQQATSRRRKRKSRKSESSKSSSPTSKQEATFASSSVTTDKGDDRQPIVSTMPSAHPTPADKNASIATADQAPKRPYKDAVTSRSITLAQPPNGLEGTAPPAERPQERKRIPLGMVFDQNKKPHGKLLGAVRVKRSVYFLGGINPECTKEDVQDFCSASSCPVLECKVMPSRRFGTVSARLVIAESNAEKLEALSWPENCFLRRWKFVEKSNSQ